ncbi:MAG: hypothetical protein CMJ18_17295 [Phycisphaeraceae bacterium]|nr:hypothetical protein [Phycisphaeraceae bacterium]
MALRILHIVDGEEGASSVPLLQLIREGQVGMHDVDQRVLLVGGAALRRRAAEAGLEGCTMRGAPGGRAWISPTSFQRAVRDMGDVDLVHCWSVGAWSASALMLRAMPRVLTVSAPVSRRVAHWLRVMGCPQRAAVLAVSSTIRGQLLGAGSDPASVHVLRPGLDLGRVEHGARAALRSQWEIDDATPVVALLDDPPARTGADGATMAASLARAAAGAADGLRLVVHPDQPRLGPARHMMDRVGANGFHLVDRRIEAPWRVLPGCDVALILGDGGGGLALLWAMAANVPIVAEATYAACEVIEDRHSALLARPDHPPLLAERIRRLLGDAQLRWKLRDTARHEAYSYFSRQRYAASLKVVYEQVLAGNPIEVPQLEATGGLRFSGAGRGTGEWVNG